MDAAVDATQRQLDDMSRRAFRLGWLVNLAGVFVTFLSVGFLIPIFLDPDQAEELGLQSAPLVVVAVVIGGVILNKLVARDRRRAFAWIIERREPTEDEHRLTLQLATLWTKRLGIAWAIGGFAIALLSLHHGLGFAGVVIATIWAGGETTCALQYLTLERTLRPVTTLALAARLPEKPIAPGIRARLLWSWALGTGVPILGVLTVGVVGLTKESVATSDVAAACIFLALVACAAGLFATVIAADAIANPVIAVRRALDRVSRGELEAEVAIDDSSEVGMLQAGFNRMAEGLREREELRDLFGRHVGQDVARAALDQGARLGGEEREIGAVFVDLVGSTSIALAMPPTDVVRLLNRFFRVVVDVIESEGGWVNKFEGDAAMCVFGAPATSADPAGDALCAARRLAERLERELPEAGFGIGVSAGRAVAGNVGAEHRFEYTVIGDPVNEAARLCDLAKEREEPALASDAALARAREKEAAAWSVNDRTVLRGRLEATGLASPVA
jgi:adenylate cyclase